MERGTVGTAPQAHPISTTAISVDTTSSTVTDRFPGGPLFLEEGVKELGIWTKHRGVQADWLQQERKEEAVTCGPPSVAVPTAGGKPIR